MHIDYYDFFANLNAFMVLGPRHQESFDPVDNHKTSYLAIYQLDFHIKLSILSLSLLLIKFQLL